MSGERAEGPSDFERVDAKPVGLSAGSKWLLAGAFGAPVAAGVFAALTQFAGIVGPILIMLYFVGLLGAVGVGIRKNWFGLVAKPGVVEVGSAGVRVDGKLVADRRKVNNAAIVRDDKLGGTRILLGKKGSPRRSLSLLAKSDDEAHAIVKRLGLDADASTATWATMGGMGFAKWGIWAQFAPLFASFPLLAVAGATQSAIPAVPAILCFLSFYALLFSKTTVVVGADGVLVKWLTMQRFCRWDEVQHVVRLVNGVNLIRRDGTSFDIKLATEQQVQNDRLGVLTPEIEALYTRIHDAMNVRNASPDAMVASDPFLRNDRSAREWLDGLRKLFEPVGGLRSAAHTEENAWRVVADGSAPEEARIGAAAALSASTDERGKEKLRAVADNVASTRVRVAIEAAAKGDEGALVDAMEELSKQDASKKNPD